MAIRAKAIRDLIRVYTPEYKKEPRDCDKASGNPIMIAKCQYKPHNHQANSNDDSKNSIKEATKDVTLAAGATQEVTFEVTKTTAATYQVDVNGLISSFAVAAQEQAMETTEPVTPTSTINWLFIGIIIAIVVIGGAVYGVLKARHRAP